MADQVERERRDAADGNEVIASRKGLDLAPVAAEPFEVSSEAPAEAPAATPDSPINEAPVDYDG
jgi:hypothetical protein